MSRKSTHKTGFTLLELVVSITLLALIALMISRVFTESAKAIDQGTSDLFLDETARFVLDALEQDISQALIRTNVAFRIYPDSRNVTLYFISTAIRKQHDNIPRDMAPMRIATKPLNNTPWNIYLEVESAGYALGKSDNSIRNLIGHSAYYITNSSQSVFDFGDVPDATYSAEYTRGSTDQLDDHAVLSFLNLTVNGDPSWNYNNPDGLPDATNMPDFVDVVIGLISTREMKMAIRLNSSERIENNERIYTRRIYMRNQGIRNLAH